MSHRKAASTIAGLLARRLEAARVGPVGVVGAASAMARERPLDGTGFGTGWSRGYAKKWPYPKSGGAEGFPDKFMNTIKKRVTPKNVHDVPEPVPGVWYGSLPDMGVERHYRKMTPEAVEALHTILDIESQPGGAELPSWEEIEAEETEEARLKAERKASLAEKEAAQRASRVSVRDAKGRSGATGKRKTAVARVTIWPGDGAVSVNGRPFDECVPDIDHRGWMIKPFLVTNTIGLFDVKAQVRGGGRSGQAQAMRHGIAKALQLYEPAFRPALKKAGMLTRDPRKVERKKPGRKKARKAFQWVKR